MWRYSIVLTGVAAFIVTTPAFVRTQESNVVVVDMNMKHKSGQSVAPVFEGWEPNKDGTFSIYFGYLNRNLEELLDIPVGPANRMEPGDDRGQPTHFLPRRHSNVFAVVVPKDFGTANKIQWTFTFRGKTETVAGTLNPLYQIDASRDTTTGNTPPIIATDNDLQVTFPQPVTLKATVTDDGLPRKGALEVIWSKYRGPGEVTFGKDTKFVIDNAALGGFWGWKPDFKGGQATTTATFSEPGIYVLRAVASDGRFGRSCCRGDAKVRVTVNQAAATGGK